MAISKVGIEVVDAHAHFFTYDTIKQWLAADTRGDLLQRMQKRVAAYTDMDTMPIPDEDWDAGQAWVDELDKYGISAIGMMISPEVWDEFNETRKRFPGRFMGYVNIDPAQDNAVELVERAARDGFQGIKLYPSSGSLHVYDKKVYPVYEAAQEHKLLAIHHFGITIGNTANLEFGNPLDIQKPAQDFPDLNLMIAHFGAGFFREVLMLMYQTDNVVMDTSGSNSWMKFQPYDLTITKIFEKALRAGTAERVVFGTDSSFFPRGFRFNILEEQYNAVKSICPQFCYSDDDIDMIFRKNILRLTGFKPK